MRPNVLYVSLLRSQHVTPLTYCFELLAAAVARLVLGAIFVCPVVLAQAAAVPASAAGATHLRPAAYCPRYLFT